MLRKILVSLGILVALFFIVSLSTIYYFSKKPLPKGTIGPSAERLYQKIAKAVNLKAWEKTEAIEFVFSLQNHFHFRDNKRGYREVTWSSKNQNYKVQYHTKGAHLSYKNNLLVKDKERAKELYQKAHQYHTNDFFWLQPFAQLKAHGTKLYYVSDQALLVRYFSGGLTPGDSYLIIVDADFLPVRWQMWVSLLPIKGYEFAFQDWKKTKTGALLSLSHPSPLFTVKLDQIKSYFQYPERGKEDRFAKLHKLLKK